MKLGANIISKEWTWQYVVILEFTLLTIGHIQLKMKYELRYGYGIEL